MTNYPECERFKGRACQVCDGRAEGVSLEKSNGWRSTHGLAPIGTSQDEWNVTMKSRGLGDTVRKFTHWTGIDKAVNAVATATGVDCGCGGRQTSLNQAIPYKQG